MLPINKRDGTFCCHLSCHLGSACSGSCIMGGDGHSLDPGCHGDCCKMPQLGEHIRQCNMSAKPLQDALTQQSARCSVHGPQGQPWSNQQHSCGCQVAPLLSHQQGVSANLLQDGWGAVSPNCRAMRSASACRREIIRSVGR